MDKILALTEMILSVLLLLVIRLEKQHPTTKWRVLYALPPVLAVTLSVFIPWDKYYAGVYIGAALFIICLFADDVRVRRAVVCIAGAVVAASLIFCMLSPLYRADDYSADFEKGFNEMKEYYVLAEEKEIDWDALYAKYSPQFAAATKEQDEAASIKLWMQFANEFYDGHVGYSFGDSDGFESALYKIFGNDYGLSLVKLTDGSYAAVNVEGGAKSYAVTEGYEELKAYKTELAPDIEKIRYTLRDAGIKNGTVITSWDGMSIKDLVSKADVMMMNMPDAENEAFYRTIHAAGYGGDTVTIGFISDDGTEKTVKAPRLGAYICRLMSTLEKIDDGVLISNLDWQKINDDTALLRIYAMSYDMKSYAGSDYREMTDALRTQLLAYKEEGVKDIIIDLRKNSGGSPFMVMGVAQLFAPEGEHIDCYCAEINRENARYERGDDGKYVKNEAITYRGEDLWADGRIVLLVNGETVSAGDEMTYLMAEYPNVTVMGYTKTNSSCQAVSSIELNKGSLSYSAVPSLTEEAEPLIDTYADHKGRVPIDIVIPVDGDMITAVFDRGEDYPLDYAREWLR